MGQIFAPNQAAIPSSLTPSQLAAHTEWKESVLSGFSGPVPPSDNLSILPDEILTTITTYFSDIDEVFSFMMVNSRTYRILHVHSKEYPTCPHVTFPAMSLPLFPQPFVRSICIRSRSEIRHSSSDAGWSPLGNTSYDCPASSGWPVWHSTSNPDRSPPRRQKDSSGEEYGPHSTRTVIRGHHVVRSDDEKVDRFLRLMRTMPNVEKVRIVEFRESCESGGRRNQTEYCVSLHGHRTGTGDLFLSDHISMERSRPDRFWSYIGFDSLLDLERKWGIARWLQLMAQSGCRALKHVEFANSAFVRREGRRKKVGYRMKTVRSLSGVVSEGLRRLADVGIQLESLSFSFARPCQDVADVGLDDDIEDADGCWLGMKKLKFREVSWKLVQPVLLRCRESLVELDLYPAPLDLSSLRVDQWQQEGVTLSSLQRLRIESSEWDRYPMEVVVVLLNSAPNLSSLTIVHTSLGSELCEPDVGDKQAISMLQDSFPALRSVFLVRFPADMNSVAAFLSRCPNLTQLVVTASCGMRSMLMIESEQQVRTCHDLVPTLDFVHLRTLQLRNVVQFLSTPSVGSFLETVLTRSELVRDVILVNCQFATEVAAKFGFPFCYHLERIILVNVLVGNWEFVQCLINTSPLLTTLHLKGCSLSGVGLVDHIYFPATLVDLRVAYNPLGSAGVAYVLSSAISVLKIDISHCAFDPSEVLSLLRDSHPDTVVDTRLTSLVMHSCSDDVSKTGDRFGDFSFGKISPEVLVGFAEIIPSLREMDLSFPWQMDDRIVRAMSRFENLRLLKSHDFNRANVGGGPTLPFSYFRQDLYNDSD